VTTRRIFSAGLFVTVIEDKLRFFAMNPDLLAPVRGDGPWKHVVLGEWKVDGARHSLERFSFAGPAGGGRTVRVGIFAGIHGDEVAGIAAAARFLPLLAAAPEIARGYEISIYPLCNPTGLAAGTRHARSGLDLNREFWLGSTEPEVALLEHEIRERRFDGLIALHADDETPGLYAFALGAQVTEHVVEPALLAAERFLPRNCHPVIDNFTAQNGLIRKGYPGMLCAPPEQSPRPFEIVFETPTYADFEHQVEANLVFLRTALDQYLQLQALGQDL
jgi:protein MpaA